MYTYYVVVASVHYEPPRPANGTCVTQVYCVIAVCMCVEMFSLRIYMCVNAIDKTLCNSVHVAKHN